MFCAVFSILDSFVHEFCYVSSHSYAFRIATELGTDLNKYFDLIEDVVAQADEVDDKYLQVRHKYGNMCGGFW